MRERSVITPGKALAEPVLKPYLAPKMVLPVNAWYDGEPWEREGGFAKPEFESYYEFASDLAKGDTRGSWNPFEHYVRETKLSSGKTEHVTVAYDGGMYPYKTHTFTYPYLQWAWQLPFSDPIGNLPSGVSQLFGRTGDGTPFVSVPSSMPVRLNDMRATMLNHSRPETSLLNALYELKDMRSLATTVARSRGLVNDVVNILPRIRQSKSFKVFCSRFQKRFRNRQCTYGDVMKALSDWLLQWSFNLSPLIADVRAIESVMSVTSDRINKIYSMSGKKRLVRYKANFSASECESHDSNSIQSTLHWHRGPWPEGVPGTVEISNKVRFGVATLRGQMEYTQWAPNLDKRQAVLYGLLDDLGVNLNPAIIWNGIPYTFLIDWLVGVSRTLDQFKRENLQLKTVIHRSCYSVTYDRTCVKTVRYVNAVTDTGERQAVVIKERAFRRFSDDPQSYALACSGLSKREFILGGALATTKWPVRRKR